jgi:HTH-type transcriptional regulator / antitoxin HigA
MATKIKSAQGKGKTASAEFAGKKTDSPSKVGAKAKGKIAGTTDGGDQAYLTLIRRFPLRPIRTDAELDAASRLIDELADRDDLSPAELDYLDVLGDLVEKYEDEHVEMPQVSDAVMLRSLMDEKGVRQADVVRGTGISKTVLSLVLNGKRDLTREHIATLSKYFEVDPAAFLGPNPELQEKAARRN